jgi:hypothetical protein
MRLSRKIRKRHYLSVPQAGKQVGYSRAGSYRAVEAGIIPVEKDGRLLLVRRALWKRIRNQILRGQLPKPQRKTAPTEATASLET